MHRTAASLPNWAIADPPAAGHSLLCPAKVPAVCFSFAQGDASLTHPHIVWIRTPKSSPSKTRVADGIHTKPVRTLPWDGPRANEKKTVCQYGGQSKEGGKTGDVGLGGQSPPAVMGDLREEIGTPGASGRPPQPLRGR